MVSILDSRREGWWVVSRVRGILVRGGAAFPQGSWKGHKCLKEVRSPGEELLSDTLVVIGNEWWRSGWMEE